MENLIKQANQLVKNGNFQDVIKSFGNEKLTLLHSSNGVNYYKSEHSSYYVCITGQWFRLV